MKPNRKGRQTRAKPFERNRGALTDSGLDVETKIFSASGRGRTFFLTSLFIELIDHQRPSANSKDRSSLRQLVEASQNLVKPLKPTNSPQLTLRKPNIFIANMSHLPYAISYHRNSGINSRILCRRLLCRPSQNPDIPPLSPLEEIFCQGISFSNSINS